MKMTRWAVTVTVMALFACSGDHQITGPSATPADGSGSKVTANDAVPGAPTNGGPVPGGPGSGGGSVPGGPGGGSGGGGGSGVPGGPSNGGPVPGGPGSGQPSGGGGNGGGGGGGGGVTCPPSVTFTYNNATTMIGGGGGGPAFVSSGNPGCLVSGVMVKMYLTSPDLSKTASFTVSLQRQNPQGGNLTDGRLILQPTSNVFTGTAIGTAACDTVFANGGGSILAASPPYSGTFAPVGTLALPNNTFDGYLNLPSDGLWLIRFFYDSGAAQVFGPCITLTLNLKAA
jgi:hypothetical protein